MPSKKEKALAVNKDEKVKQGRIKAAERFDRLFADIEYTKKLISKYDLEKDELTQVLNNITLACANIKKRIITYTKPLPSEELRQIEALRQQRGKTFRQQNKYDLIRKIVRGESNLKLDDMGPLIETDDKSKYRR